MNDFLDNAAHRQQPNYSTSEMRRRSLVSGLRPFIRLIPRPLYSWRNACLRLCGAQLGKANRIYPDAVLFFPWMIKTGDFVTIGPRVQLYSLGAIHIGSHVLISQGAHLCAGTHDHHQPELPLKRLPIYIEPEVWIGAEAFIGPGVTIGKGCVVGARAVVVKSAEPRSILGGNPARTIRKREADYPIK